MTTSTAEVTQFGFTWGPATIERAMAIGGHVVLEVIGARGVATIRVTPSGMVFASTEKRKRKAKSESKVKR